jgi:hypothetical protein
MTILKESLRAGDLKHMVKKVFGVDSYKSKIGNDEEVVVLSFTVDHEDPAKDLENFIEMGYDFVLDADITPGETDDGYYIVFVELERGRHVARQIMEIVSGVNQLTGFDAMRFRYFKNFKSQEATEESLKSIIPMDKESYAVATEHHGLENFSEFFVNSYADEIKLLDESIVFNKNYAGSIAFEIVNSSSKEEIYNSIKGPIVLEGKDMAEVMFLTKVIGNYNITKIGSTFIFENSNYAVALKRKL